MWKQHLLDAGPVIYPLIACSLIALTLVIERLLVLSVYRSHLPQFAIEQFRSNGWPESRRGLSQGLALLHENCGFEKSLRDELLSGWLQEQKTFLLARSRWLLLIGALAPMLGLLGTVLGIITMFQEVAHESGPVTPSMLASGMWEAMATTALGLMIAIPAVAVGQVIGIWGDHRVEYMAAVLNRCSLWLEQQHEVTEDTLAAPLAATGKQAA